MSIQTSKTRKTKNQTIERAAPILTCFTAEKPHWTLAELATKLDMTPSTTYRYVAALVDARLLERDERRGGYRLGLSVVELAYVVLNQMEVRKQALDEMEALRDEFDLLVNLAVLVEGDVLHIAHSVPSDWPRWHVTVGRRAVAHCTSLGKILLAYQPWPTVQQIIKQYGWRPYTPRSIQDFPRLEAELTQAREQGYSIDEEERNIGTVCLAAPIRDYSGKVIASLSMTCKTEKLSVERRTQFLPRLLEAANRISFRLGYHDSTAYL
ncbi:MAG: IclR family transcriptional regulator [Ktedonobacteraceae bacterium]|nr:IclR family transcriptional regulator [Ktedonobacteraceae bacterium]